jgi:cytochrome c556
MTSAKAKSSGAAILICALASIAMPASAQSGEEVIKSRINFMKDEMERHWEPLAAFAAKGIGSLADVDKNATALAALAKKIPQHFPKDTGRGKYPDKITRALPEIWQDWTRFQDDVQLLADNSEKLARLAREGNKDEVVQMIGTSGSYAKTRLGCAECHSDFRGPRVK